MLYILYGLLAVLSAIIVAAEMATYSTRRDRLLALAEQGDRRAKLAVLYLRAPRWYLAGSQLAMTLTSTVMGLLSSRLFSQPLSVWFESRGLNPASAQSAGFWTATIALTLLLTVFVNLLPKRIAFAYADWTAMFFARAAWIWIKGTGPILKALNWTVDAFARTLRLRDTGDSDITERDVLTLLREGRRDKLIDPSEFEIVRNALALSDRKITEVMTPRNQIAWIDLNSNDPAHLATRLKVDRSQIPVAEGNLDNVVGYVKVRELLVAYPNPTLENVRACLMPCMRIPKSATALQTLNTLRGSQARLAFIGDDHGHIIGLASLNDLVELVLGEIVSIH
jgi:putative hemolysin